MKKLFFLSVLLGLLAGAGFAEKIELGPGKTLLLTLPPTWTGTEAPARPPGFPEMGRSVRYATRNGSNDAILITVLPVPDDRFSDPENLRAVAEIAAQQFATGSVEGKVSLKEAGFGGTAGFTATFTDARLVGKPSIKGDYKAMTACFIYLGERIMVTATIFTDEIDGKAYTEALRILKSMSLQLPNDKI